MMSSKLLQTLKALSKAEMKEFELFLQSPYHNRGKEAEAVLSLFKLLQKNASNPNSADLDKEAVSTVLFPGMSLVPGKLEKLKGSLFQLLGKFIAMHQQEYPVWLGLANFYRDRNLPKLSMQQYNLGLSMLNGSAQISLEHHLLLWKLKDGVSTLHSLFAQKSGDLSLPESLQALDSFYILTKLNYACLLRIQGLHNDLSADIEQSMSLKWLYESLPGLKPSILAQDPAISCYVAAYELLLSLDQNKQSLLEKLEKSLEENGDKLHNDTQRTLHTILRIYVVRQYNTGGESYLPMAFRTYRLHLEKGWLYHADKLLPENILNIVQLGLRNKEAQWVYDFLQAHRYKIGGNYPPDETYQYNMALYHFHCKTFDAAGSLLSQDFQNFHYKVGARRLEMMVLYEEKSVLLTSKTEAFKMFIFRLSKKQMPLNLKQSNNNFIDILRQIMLPATLGNAQRIAKIKLRLKQETHIAERGWLLEKLEELQ